MKRWIAGMAAGALAFGLARPGQAQTPSATAPAGPPDIVVLVYQQPGKGALVDMTYAHSIPHVQAQGDEAALAQAAGTTAGTAKVTDGEAPVQRKMGPMTGIVFNVPNLIPDDAQTLPVEPFITALRHYRRLALIFSVSPGPGARFQPLGNYADNNVKIAMTQTGTVYTYRVQVLNPNFDRLNLPQSPGLTTAPADAVSRRHAPWALLAGLVAAAIAAGVLVYTLMVRKTPPPPSETPDALSEEQTHIGTKG